MTTDMKPIPEPYHRWAANEGLDAPKAFSMKDKCLSCGVSRYDPMTGERALRRNAVAAGPCPLGPWRSTLTDEQIAALVAAYTEDES